MAQKMPDVNERDELIVTAVFSGAVEQENVTQVVEAVDKISDSDLRAFYLSGSTFSAPPPLFELKSLTKPKGSRPGWKDQSSAPICISRSPGIAQ
jgi:hypothetical protein